VPATRPRPFVRTTLHSAGVFASEDTPPARVSHRRPQPPQRAEWLGL